MQLPISFYPPLSTYAGRIDALPELPEPIYGIDTEHRGLGRDALLSGIAIAGCHEEWYLPTGHAEGPNHQLETVRRWAHEHLAGKHLIFREAKNDIEVLRRSGIDVEVLGCVPHEIQHAAALLDDSRRKFTLEALMQDRLKRGKVPIDYPIETTWEQPAVRVAPYARGDARGTYDLHLAYAADIEKEGMTELLELEDGLIYCVLGMQNEMCYLDVPKLDRWIGEVRQEHAMRVMELYRRTGLRINPDSPQDVAKLFKYMGMKFFETADGNPSFGDPFLQRHIDVPEVRCIVEGRDLSSLLSKYLLKYRNALLPGGKLPYLLHQLRADDYGTITGRFASSKINIQQVFKPDKQAVTSPVTMPWIVRELFIESEDRGHLIMRFTVHDEVNGGLHGKWLHSDASQIEYRLFAHFSCVPKPHTMRLIDAYHDNPTLSYHKWVHKELLKERMIYSHAKNFNFMKLYGGGVEKVMAMCSCDRPEAEKLSKLYDREVPEASRLLWFCNDLAEQRGYIKTILNRRRRYHPGDRYYSALNSVLQGSAADLMKLKLRRLYDERRNIKTMKDAEECYAIQEFDLRVPITWELALGNNWKETC